MLIQVDIFADVLIYREIFWKRTFVVVQIVHETIVGEICGRCSNRPSGQ